jgi:hypothetical protein
MFAQLAGRPGAGLEQVEDLPAPPVGQRLEDRVIGRPT